MTQFHVIMGLGLLAGTVYLLFNKRSVGIAVFPGCLLGTLTSKAFFWQPVCSLNNSRMGVVIDPI